VFRGQDRIDSRLFLNIPLTAEQIFAMSRWLATKEFIGLPNFWLHSLNVRKLAKTREKNR
jgi:hypothetical protein